MKEARSHFGFLSRAVRHGGVELCADVWDRIGRFSSERKMVLDALRDELRKRNYAPVVFDFEKPSSGTTINTVTLLARMARFVIAAISDAKSVLQELQAIVPSSPKFLCCRSSSRSRRSPACSTLSRHTLGS